MRLLTDLHIAPRTVAYLRGLGHELQQVTDRLAADATDSEIVELARREDFVILTQDLDFSALVSVSGLAKPSVISLRLGSASVERVNAALASILPTIPAEMEAGAIVSVGDDWVRIRSLPVR